MPGWAGAQTPGTWDPWRRAEPAPPTVLGEAVPTRSTRAACGLLRLGWWRPGPLALLRRRGAVPEVPQPRPGSPLPASAHLTSRGSSGGCAEDGKVKVTVRGPPRRGFQGPGAPPVLPCTPTAATASQPLPTRLLGHRGHGAHAGLGDEARVQRRPDWETKAPRRLPDTGPGDKDVDGDRPGRGRCHGLCPHSWAMARAGKALLSSSMRARHRLGRRLALG